MPEPEAATTSAVEETKPSASPTDASEDAVFEQMNAAPAEEPSAPDAEKPSEEPPSEPAEKTEAAPAEPTEAEEEEPEPDLEAKVELPENAFHKYGKVQVVGEDGKPIPLFKHLPELRGVIGQQQAYAELGTVGELRALRESFPTAEDVEAAQQTAEQLRTFEDTFRGSPDKFLDALSKVDAGSFRKVAEIFPDALHQFDPQLYSQQAHNMTRGVLAAWRRQSERTGNQDALDAIDAVSQVLFGGSLNAASGPQGQPDARDARIAELERKLTEREKQEQQGKFESFLETGTTQFEQTLGTELAATLKEKYPGANNDQLAYMLKEAADAVMEKLNAQPATVQRVQGMLAAARDKGKAGQADLKAFVDFQLAAARRIAPIVLREKAPKWTTAFIGVRKAQTEKAQTIAATTREPGAKVGASPAPQSKPGEKPKPKPLSEDEIFAQINA